MALMHDGSGDIKNLFSLSCINEEFASDSVSAWASLSGRQTLCSKQKTSNEGAVFGKVTRKNLAAYSKSCLDLKGRYRKN